MISHLAESGENLIALGSHLAEPRAKSHPDKIKSCASIVHTAAKDAQDKMPYVNAQFIWSVCGLVCLKLMIVQW